MDAIVHALCAANQDQENVLQALRDFRGCYESWGPGKVEVLPQNAVKAITNVVSSHLPSVALGLSKWMRTWIEVDVRYCIVPARNITLCAMCVLERTSSSLTAQVSVGLQCLWLIGVHASHAAAALRLEGGLQLCLKVLKRHQSRADITALACRTLAKCSSGSVASVQAILKEKGGWACLMGVLKANCTETTVMLPLSQLLAMLTRYRKGAVQMAKDGLLDKVAKAMEYFKGEWVVFGSLLKIVKNLAKHEDSRPTMVHSGQWRWSLLEAAEMLATRPEQYKLFKRLYRTLWLLHPDMVSEMPEPELHWELPWRDQSKCSLPSAADCAGSRALELFPEMHDPARENASPTPAKSHDIRQVRHAVNIVDPPQRAKDMTKHFLDHPLPPEPLHWDGESVVPQMMMYMLQRLVNPSQLIQRVVFDNADIGAAGTSCSIPLCGGADDPHHSEARRINADGASPAVSKDIRLLQEELERWNSSGWRSLADGAPPSDPLAPPSAQPGARRAPIPDGCDGCMESPPQLGALGCRLNAWAQGGGSDRRSIGARRLGGGHGESPCVGKNGPLEVSACSPAVAEGDRCEAVGPGRGGWLECMRGHLAGEEGRGPDRLEFESRWECGNLRRAVQVYEHEYDLFLTSDVNENEDKGNRQWFLFSVRNATPGVQYRLNIVNFSKKASLYNSGTRPLMCSGQGEPLGNEQVECPLPLNGQQHSAGWHRIGEEVCYFPSPCRGRHAMHRKCAPKRITGKKKTGSKAQVKAVREGLTFDLPDVGPGLWCLSFVVSFPTAGSHYLAACYPYGYSDLKAFLDGSEANEAQSRQHHQQVVYRGLLSQTLQGHRCDLITITDFSASPEVMDRKEYVVVTARVHPGETSGSWVMQGLLEFLLSTSPTAQSLRRSFVFKIIPMLNPDGVVNGNYRCNLAGVDLNRVWDRPDPHRHPTIYHAKKLVETLAATGRLALFLDLHGHSRKMDTFLYGCEPSGSSAFTVPTSVPDKPFAVSNKTSKAESGSEDCSPKDGPACGAENGARLSNGDSEVGTTDECKGSVLGDSRARLRVRMLPYLLSWYDPGYSLEKCSFKVRRSKMSTGRVVVCQEIGVTGSYTVEASLGGCSSSNTHFTAADYYRMGKSLCHCIAELANVNDEELLQRMANEGI